MKLSHIPPFLLSLLLWLTAIVGLQAQTAGNLDTAFAPTVSFQGTLPSINFTPAVKVIAVQQDGKVIIGGDFNTVETTTCNGVARLNADGTVDTTFVSGLAAGSFVSRVALLPDGKMLVCSTIPSTTYPGTTSIFSRLNADGSVDTTFTRPSNYVDNVTIQPDGKILLAGNFLHTNPVTHAAYYTNEIVRLNSDGSMDNSFNLAGGISGGFSVDAGNGVVPGASPISGMAVQPDGKILVKGNFSLWYVPFNLNIGSWIPRNHIARLNADGSLDPSFDPGSILTGGSNMIIASLAALDDGKILVIGSFSGSYREPAPRIVRLNADGTLDGTFSSVPDSDLFYFTLLSAQVDGKILVGGTFAAVDGQPRVKIARLNADGSLESTATFDAGTGIGVTYPSYNFDSLGNRVPPFTSPDITKPLALALQPDGKILLGGDFTAVNGQARNRIVRLLNDAASQTLTVANANQVQWQRAGALAGVAQASFQLSTDGGTTWSKLGNGTRMSDGWQITGLTLPASGIVRAIGVPVGGNSSTGLSQSFSGLPVFTVSATPSPAANGSVTGGGNLAAGSAVTLVATPAAGCDFTGWTENGTLVSSSATYTFTANADRTLIANFTRRSYTITSTSSFVSGGVTRGGGTFSHGTQVLLIAIPAAGYHFSSWSENGNTVGTSASLNFPAEGDRALVVNFAQNSYTVSASPYPSEGGSITRVGNGAVTHGAKVTLVATPAPGYKFAGWSEFANYIHPGTTLSFSTTSNRTLLANFTPVFYSFSNGDSYNAATKLYTGASGGSLNFGTIDTTTYNSAITIGILNTGGGLINLGNGGLTFTTITTITTSASPSFGGSVVGGGTVTPGVSATVLATPAAGFTFVNWTENGTQVGTSPNYTFTPSANRTLVANFIGSSNADLSALLSDQAQLTPAFEANVTSYFAKVPTGTDKFTLMPAPAQEGATFKINGFPATTGGSNPEFALNVGSNTITLTVTAPDGVTTKTYTVTVKRSGYAKDLNGDGTADFVFQNKAGQIAAWYSDANGMPIFSHFLSSAALGDWKLAGVADMNSDGIPDFIFQNGIGQTFVWYLNAGGAAASSGYISSSGLGDWKIVTTADIDGDGNTDLLFQNNYGQIVVWYMNGAGGVRTSAYLSTALLGDWRVRCAADLNGDGIADLVFQNTVGQLCGWRLNSSGGVVSSGYLDKRALGDWKLAGAADINGDGIPDLLFQNSSGQITVWYMNGNSSYTSSAYLSTITLGDWRLR